MKFSMEYGIIGVWENRLKDLKKLKKWLLPL